MKIPKEIQDTIDTASPVGLRAMVEHLLERATVRGAAVMEQVESFREILELLRAGRITDATELAERIVTASDEALGSDNPTVTDLSAMRSQGSA